MQEEVTVVMVVLAASSAAVPAAAGGRISFAGGGLPSAASGRGKPQFLCYFNCLVLNDLYYNKKNVYLVPVNMYFFHRLAQVVSS